MIRILIVTDVRLYRDGLAAFLGKHDDVTVIGTADGGAAALAVVQCLSPDVILVDQAMRESKVAIRDLVAVLPSTRIVALGVADTDHDVIACAEAGISGYVQREASLEDLIAVVHSVVRGELLCSPQVAASLLRRVALRAAASAEPVPSARLTSREGQILQLIEQGLSNKEIASRLGIEVATVKNHVHNLLEKLQVHRRGEAVARSRIEPSRSSRGQRATA